MKNLLLIGILLAMGSPGIPAQAQVFASSSEIPHPHKQSQGKAKSLKSQLDELASRFKVSIAYKDELVENQQVSLSKNKFRTAEEGLKALLKESELDYEKAGDNFYVIFLKNTKTRKPIQSIEKNTDTSSFQNQENGLNVMPALKNIQQTLIQMSAKVFTITGKVLSDTGEELPGVNILLKGSTTGTTTNANGNYSLSIPDASTNGVLVFSYIGFTTEEISINNQIVINATLLPDIKSLTEVVVVGYGTQKRSDLTGSIASISSKEIKSVVITSADQALQGRAPGVQVIQNSSAPGAGTTVRIRGGNSIQGGNEPLYVIDGIPIYNSNGSSGANVNGLSSISTSDIESVEILKDASATAIYGSRGANGVVIITTKRGKAGQSTVNFESYYGVQQVRRKYPLLNATEFANLINEANTNEGRNPVYTAEQIEAFGKGTDWQDEIFTTAPIQNYQLSMTGGDEKTLYAISGNFFRQDGIVVNSNFNRASFRLNLDRTINSKFKIGNNLTFSRAITNAVSTDGTLGSPGQVIANALQISPTLPVYQPDGSYTIQNIAGGQITDNPVALANDSKNKTSVSRILGSIFGEYKIIEGLTLRVLLGIDGAYLKDDSYLPKTVLSGSTQGGVAAIGNNQTLTWLNENTLTYSKNFNETHNLTLLAGYTQQASRAEASRASTRNFVNDILGYDNLGGGSVLLTPSSSIGTWGLVSYLARVNYGYKDKYLFTVTGRLDASSRFGTNNRNGFFPSASVAWRLIEEPFLRNLNVFSDLKLRTSYGITGNQEGIGNYPAFDLLGTQNYVLNNVVSTGVGPSQVANPDLKWETTAQFDFGLDMAFLNDRISVTADIYQKRTRDLLLFVTIPSTSGYTSALKNIGKVENKGIELGITSRNITSPFSWTTSFNISANKNTVLDIGSVSQIFAGQVANIGQNLSSGIIRVGEPLGSFYGYVTDGVFQASDYIASSAQPTAKPGDRRYKDLFPDNKIDDNDRTIIGRAQPRLVGGITNTFSFKGVELTVFLQGVSGNDILNANRFELEYLSGSTNQDRDMLSRWTPENTQTDIPRATTNRAANRISSRQIEDGSYLRLKNVQLAYNLPTSLLKPLRLQSLRVYASAQNYATWTNYSGYDPEVNRFGQENVSQGFDYGSYPASKMLMLGLNIGL